MLTYTAVTTGAQHNNAPDVGTVFDDGPGVEVLNEVTVVGTGSGVGVLQTSALGGNAAWLLAVGFGALLTIGYYIDFHGVKHDAAFTYTAKVSTVRVNGQVRTGVALDTTTNAPTGDVSYVQDYSYGGWLGTTDSQASL